MEFGAEISIFVKLEIDKSANMAKMLLCRFGMFLAQLS